MKRIVSLLLVVVMMLTMVPVANLANPNQPAGSFYCEWSGQTGIDRIDIEIGAVWGEVAFMFKASDTATPVPVSVNELELEGAGKDNFKLFSDSDGIDVESLWAEPSAASICYSAQDGMQYSIGLVSKLPNLAFSKSGQYAFSDLVQEPLTDDNDDGSYYFSVNTQNEIARIEISQSSGGNEQVYVVYAQDGSAVSLPSWLTLTAQANTTLPTFLFDIKDCDWNNLFVRVFHGTIDPSTGKFMQDGMSEWGSGFTFKEPEPPQTPENENTPVMADGLYINWPGNQEVERLTGIAPGDTVYGLPVCFNGQWVTSGLFLAGEGANDCTLVYDEEIGWIFTGKKQAIRQLYICYIDNNILYSIEVLSGTPSTTFCSTSEFAPEHTMGREAVLDEQGNATFYLVRGVSNEDETLDELKVGYNGIWYNVYPQADTLPSGLTVTLTNNALPAKIETTGITGGLQFEIKTAFPGGGFSRMGRGINVVRMDSPVPADTTVRAKTLLAQQHSDKGWNEAADLNASADVSHLVWFKDANGNEITGSIAASAHIALEKTTEVADGNHVIYEVSFTKTEDGMIAVQTNDGPYVLFARAHNIQPEGPSNPQEPVGLYATDAWNNIRTMVNGMVGYSIPELEFFFRPAEGEAPIPVSQGELYVNDQMILISNEESGKLRVDLLWAEPGETQITYFHENKPYTMKVITLLPQACFATAPTYSFDKLIHDPVDLDGTGEYYLLFRNQSQIQKLVLQVQNLGSWQKKMYTAYSANGESVTLPENMSVTYEGLDTDNGIHVFKLTVRNLEQSVQITPQFFFDTNNFYGKSMSIEVPGPGEKAGIYLADHMGNKMETLQTMIGGTFEGNIYYMASADAEPVLVKEGLYLDGAYKDNFIVKRVPGSDAWRIASKFTEPSSAKICYKVGKTVYSITLNAGQRPSGFAMEDVPYSLSSVLKTEFTEDAQGNLFAQAPNVVLDANGDAEFYLLINPTSAYFGQPIADIYVSIWMNGRQTRHLVYSTDPMKEVTSVEGLGVSVTGSGAIRHQITGWNATASLSTEVWFGDGNFRLNDSITVSDPHHANRGQAKLAKVGDYTIGLSFLSDDRLRMIGGSAGFGIPEEGGEHTVFYVLGVMKKYNTDKEEEGYEFYKYIQNVEFYLQNVVSDLEDPNAFLTLKPDDFNRNDKATTKILYLTNHADPGSCLVCADVTYQTPEMSEPETVTVSCHLSFMEHKTFTINRPMDDTVEKLNADLASYEALMAYIERENPVAYQMMLGMDSLRNYSIDIALAPIEYRGLIACNTDDRSCMWGLVGTNTEDAHRTTVVGGLLVNQYVGGINNISFVADDAYRVTYKNEQFTCGILSVSDISTVANCSFLGYDVAMRNTDTGHTMPSHGNVFVKNDVAVWFDSAAKSSGNANDYMARCAFIENGVAVRITGMPTYISPYETIISECDFLGNELDLDVTVEAGKYYFIRNFFGDKDGNFRPAKKEVHGLGNGHLITDLRYRYRVGIVRNGWVLDDPAGAWSCGWKDLRDNSLTTDNDKFAMRQDDAKNHKVDKKTLDERENLEIEIRDKEDKPVGRWEFGDD